MKRSLLNRPVFVLPIAFGIAALLARTGWRLHSENELLRAARMEAPSASQPAHAPSASTPPAPSKDEASARTRLAELRAELEKETAARTAMETKATELAAKLPTKEGDVVVSFGRIEQMGQASANLIRIFTSDAFRKLTTGKPNAGELPEEQQREMMDAFQKHLGQIPELQRMEDNPGEIARYQAAVLQDVYGLDEATARKVNAMLEAEFAKLKASGLTVSQRTEAEKASWEKQRTAAMQDLAARVKPLLPAGHAQLEMLPGMLNLGEGLRTTVNMNADGHGSVMMTLPMFPMIPSL